MNEMVKPVMNQAVPVITKGLHTARLSGPDPEKDKEKVCKGFEAYFINSILQQLQKTTQFSKKGHTEQNYMSVVYEKVADFLADKGIGVKEMLMRYADKGNTKVLQKSGDNVIK